jgi:mono/diheme cytochrome c family protein/plastocyanin
MTDQSGDRPDGRPTRRQLPARRPDSVPVPARPVERFTAPRQTRAISGLTTERAAKIVRQSGDARWVAFLGVVVVALFVIVYYFYEMGVPLINTTPRLKAEETAQQVTAVERGYNLYEANCARCHGYKGEGGAGPVLNDQSKLFSHLSEQYIHNVLTVGGRLVCGNPKSIMPVWADTNGGPLNYLQIEDLIAFIRAPSTQEYTRRTPEFNEPILDANGKVITFKGWRDPNYKPEASATPVPDCWSATSGSQAPSQSIDPNKPVVTIKASDGAAVSGFDTKTVTVKADTAFTLTFDNQDTTTPPHNVVVSDPQGAVVNIGDNPFFAGPATRSYNYPALASGSYPFVCQVHPTTMTGTLTVQ